MKQSFFTFVALLLILSACQPSQKNEGSKTHAGKACCRGGDKKCTKTMPMELNSFKTIKLQAPDTTCGAPLMKAARDRKSDRSFESTNLSLAQLSDVLWMANGVNREDGKRTVPSALALYPLQVYAVLANGIYYYDPAKHELQPVIEGDHRQLAGLQDFVYNAPLNLLFIADYKAYKERNLPKEKHLYLAALDAGHCTQNVYLYCAAKGLKAVVRAGAKEAELLRLLEMDSDYQFIVAQTIGC